MNITSRLMNGLSAKSAALFCALLVGACSPSSFTPAGFDFSEMIAPQPASQSVSAYASTGPVALTHVNGKERDCLVRAMYFESNRSSEEGMFAVGTVVMNRVDSARFPNSICGVVGAPRQFAPGVLSRAMTEPTSAARAASVADRVLGGDRHRGVRTAKFFHQAGLRFPYNNMNYVLEAGGNEFYIKG